MDYCREILEIMVVYLEKKLRNHTAEIKTFPKGSLINNGSTESPRFCWSKPQTGKQAGKRPSRIRIAADSDTINQLARKQFLLNELEITDRNLHFLQTALNKYESTDVSEIISTMKNAYRLIDRQIYYDTNNEHEIPMQLVSELQKLTGNYPPPTVESKYRHSLIPNHSLNYITSGRLYELQDWANEPYKKSTRPFGNEIIRTSFGLRVRSRAELVIAEKLHEYEIPFRYEQLLYLAGEWLSPDFTFLDAGDNEFYWEYCGMMDDPDYVEGYKHREELYRLFDIVPWRNIIFTYAQGLSFDAALIESTIRHHILPRL